MDRPRPFSVEFLRQNKNLKRNSRQDDEDLRSPPPPPPRTGLPAPVTYRAGLQPPLGLPEAHSPPRNSETPGRSPRKHSHAIYIFPHFWKYLSLCVNTLPCVNTPRKMHVLPPLGALLLFKGLDNFFCEGNGWLKMCTDVWCSQSLKNTDLFWTSVFVRKWPRQTSSPEGTLWNAMSPVSKYGGVVAYSLNPIFTPNRTCNIAETT